MMRRVLFLCSILIFVWSLTGFPQAQPQNPPAAQDEPSPVLTVPKDYRYNAHGRRDPFVNPVPKPKAGGGPEGTPVFARPPGLKGILVREAQIAGVVTSKVPSMNVAIISAAGVKAPYFAHVGDHLYDGIVKNIQLDTVTFALTASNGDPKSPREIVRKVRPKPGEDK
jgi:hypothetical protein